MVLSVVLYIVTNKLDHYFVHPSLTHSLTTLSSSSHHSATDTSLEGIMSSDKKSFPAHNIIHIDNVTFSSNFDNGNLLMAEKKKHMEYMVWSACDNQATPHQTKHCTWFYFTVTGLPQGSTVKIVSLGTVTRLLTPSPINHSLTTHLPLTHSLTHSLNRQYDCCIHSLTHSLTWLFFIDLWLFCSML